MKLANLEEIEYQHKISAVSSCNPKHLAPFCGVKSPPNHPRQRKVNGEGRARGGQLDFSGMLEALLKDGGKSAALSGGRIKNVG